MVTKSLILLALNGLFHLLPRDTLRIKKNYFIIT